ncbi:FxsA family protein [Streptomyces sp. MUM 203J]|uniref:FxsA family membrane protein n=1 Tax=Streptomyces sp. MUM 203J TaxID=2791990 RepID=UPI001F048102|nr:FxsA family membrane protein [Streptomyces sp. MUM 203J]MCH0542208.1 FxsA family protein [Streptomyces sp. MUM 203J]
MTTGAPPPLARKRSRVRTYAPLGIAAWLVLEIWLLTLLGDAAGGLTVLAVLVAGAVLGGAVVKHAGRRAFTVLTQTMQRLSEGAAPPDRAGRGNGFLMLGGVLLMLPGLISDAVGLLLLIPPVRRALSTSVERTLESRMGPAFQQARVHDPNGKVVQGEVVRDDPPGRDDTPRTPLNP